MSVIERGWFPGYGEFARTAEGGYAISDTPEATQFTCAGAFSRVCPAWSEIYAIRAMNIALRRVHGQKYISEWENALGRTQAEVVELFNKAIALETTQPVGIDYGP
jgi:hypothetical protein